MEIKKTNNKKDRGVLYFAYNNEQINYVSQAAVSAALAKKYLTNVGAALVTSEFDLPYGNEHGVDPEEVFDHIIITDPPWEDQYRIYRDGQDTKQKLPYRNINRIYAYDLSPFNETLLLDTDYIIQSNILDHCWGNIEPLMINHKATTVTGDDVAQSEIRLNEKTIPMYWATVVYFIDHPITDAYFTFIKNATQYYKYYSKVFKYPSNAFRNDFVFSVASHMLDDYNENGFISTLPNNKLVTSLDKDIILDVDFDTIKFFSYKYDKTQYHETVHLVPTKVFSDVHIMNKFTLSSWLSKLAERI